MKMPKSVQELNAELYDLSVPDWPGEIAFYRELALAAKAQGQPVLEVGCGTGRVTLQLARDGVNIVGSDLSAEMLEIAHQKSANIPNVHWVQSDMRSLELNERFGLVVIPGHSFQFMLTPEDQLTCLEAIKRHLLPGGVLVVHLDHLDISWLGQLRTGLGGVFEAGKDVQHPATGHTIRKANAWTYEPSTQTATVVSTWEEIGADGEVLQRWEREAMKLHCIFRFEMAHLLARAGFDVQALHGDFYKNPLGDESSDMVWVARKPVV
jgi:SAM-dependent methyltransferase